jgi:hypothetical protein
VFRTAEIISLALRHLGKCNIWGFHGDDYEGFRVLGYKIQFVLHRKHITSLLYSPRFEIFTAMAMKNTVFWDVTTRGSCKNRSFGGTYRLHHDGDKNRRARKNVSFSANVVPSTPILVTLMMEAISSSETSGLIIATRRHIPEDRLLYLRRNYRSKHPNLRNRNSSEEEEICIMITFINCISPLLLLLLVCSGRRNNR